jgi:uncharacterized protein (DUF433 family)
MDIVMATAAPHIPGSTGDAHIVKRPGYCGGKAAIDETRVRVNNIASLRKEGKTPEQMVEVYPHLNLEQVYAALVYYYEHIAEIEAELRAEIEFEAGHEARKAAHLASRARS